METGPETMTIVSEATAISGKAMRYSTTVDNNRLFGLGKPKHTGDWDMLVKWKISGLGTTGDIPIRAMAEVTGGTTAQYGYAGILLQLVVQCEFRITRTVQFLLKATGNGIITSLANTWYWYRFNLLAIHLSA